MEIWIMVVAIIFAGLAVCGTVMFRRVINPITVFCGIWAVLLFGYGLHLFGLYSASSKALTIIIVGVLMFFIGAFVVSVLYLRTPRVNVDASLQPDSELPNYRVILFLNLLSFVFLFGLGIATMRLLLAGRSFYVIHKIYNQPSGVVGSSRLNQNLITWFVWPLMDISMASVAVMILCDRRKSATKRFCIILIILNLALFTIITGKRSHLGYAAMYVVAVLFLQKRKIRLKSHTKIALMFGLALVVWAGVAISASRGVKSIFQTLYIYLVGCMPHLSTKLQNIPVDPKWPTSIYGFYQAPLLAVNSVAHSSYLAGIRASMSSLLQYTQERVEIAPGITYNAFLTPFFFFYLDGGMAGVVVFSILFGMLSAGVYVHHLKKRSFGSMVIYLLIFFCLYMSMVRIQFFQMRFVLAFFYAIFFFKKPRVRFTFGQPYRLDADRVSLR